MAIKLLRLGRLRILTITRKTKAKAHYGDARGPRGAEKNHKDNYGLCSGTLGLWFIRGGILSR